MNKNVLIIGGVALVGVVAYLYFKPKATGTTGTIGTTGTTGTGSTGTGTGATMPPAGTVFTTPEEVEAITVKISSARDLTKTICDLKKQYKITEDEMNDFMNITGLSAGLASGVHSSLGTAGSSAINTLSTAQTLFQQSQRRKEAVKTVAESIKQLKELGYKEDGCKMVKIA
jgi:hypothetical protein